MKGNLLGLPFLMTYLNPGMPTFFLIFLIIFRKNHPFVDILNGRGTMRSLALQ